MSAHRTTPALEAAWFALGRAFTFTGPHDIEAAHAIVAEHRPAIEAAVLGAIDPERVYEMLLKALDAAILAEKTA